MSPHQTYNASSDSIPVCTAWGSVLRRWIKVPGDLSRHMESPCSHRAMFSLRCGRGSGHLEYACVGFRSICEIANFDIIIAIHIHIYALIGVFNTGLAAVLDAFGT